MMLSLMANQAYSVILGMALSSDANFAGQTPSPVSVVNQDNDAAGFTLTPTSPLVTTESGGTATFNVVLNTQPLASVTIPLLSSNPLEGALGQTFLTFTAANWNIAQSVIVTGVDDPIVDGDQPYSIVLGPAVSLDPSYLGATSAGRPCQHGQRCGRGLC